MDHDQQVTPRPSSVGAFLDRPLLDEEREREQFDLEAEFAQAAKHKNYWIPAAVAGFLVILALGAWAASAYTETTNRQSTVSIGAFDDLKLKEVFDTVRKNQKDLDTVKAQIAQAQAASEAKKASLRQAGAAEVEVAGVDDPDGSKAEAARQRTQTALAAETRALAAVLVPLQAQAAEIQKKIDGYDDRIGAINRQAQAKLDSQQRAADLERQRLAAGYEAQLAQAAAAAEAQAARLTREKDSLVAALKAKHAEEIRQLILKYNPVVTEAPWAAWIAAGAGQAASYPDGTLPARIADQALVPPALQAALAAKTDRIHRLVERLAAIPSENSVPGLVHALDLAVADAQASALAYAGPLAAALTAQDGVIADRDRTIAGLQAEAASLRDQIAGLKADLDKTRADDAAALAASQAQTSAATEAGRQALVPWTGALASWVAGLKEDGVVVDPAAAGWLTVFKADREALLKAAVPLAPGTKGTAPNLVSVRDGQTGAEVAAYLFTAAGDRWTVETVKAPDPKRPVRPLDRLVLAVVPKK